MSVAPWNPRYVLYARDHGRSPEEQTDHDRERWRGGLMTGFILWIGERWAEWRRVTGHVGPASPEQHAAFDAWLEGQIVEEQAA